MKKYLIIAIIIIALLALADGYFTKAGLENGLYIGEYNRLLSAGFDFVGINETLAVRAFFVVVWLVAVLFILNIYPDTPLTYIPIVLVTVVYLVVNAYHLKYFAQGGF